MPIGWAIGGALLGDAVSAFGTASTNSANMAEVQANNQAAMDRQKDAEAFNAQQVSQQEAFQTAQVNSAEAWDEQMSNTQMQRRVADLKAAGINPLLAVSQGGASAPTINPASGSAASIGPASGSGTIQMQNPAAAFGNLGGQLSSAAAAAQTGAQIDLLNAQTEKVKAEAGQEIPAQVDYLKSMTGLTNTNATQAYYNTQKIQEEIYGQRLSNDQLRDITTQMQGQNLEVLKATRDALISAANSDATAKALNLQGIRNQNYVQQGNFGKIIATLNAILQPISTATKAAGVQ